MGLDSKNNDLTSKLSLRIRRSEDDFNKKLGEPLASRETSIYLSIDNSGVDGITPVEIFDEVIGDDGTSEKQKREYVYCILRKVRAKLGEESVLNEEGRYYSKRALISNRENINK